MARRSIHVIGALALLPFVVVAALLAYFAVSADARVPCWLFTGPPHDHAPPYCRCHRDEGARFGSCREAPP
jgi:hypothetical protein